MILLVGVVFDRSQVCGEFVVSGAVFEEFAGAHYAAAGVVEGEAGEVLVLLVWYTSTINSAAGTYLVELDNRFIV